MHTLKVTLKQHTPLIHFQPDQDGAKLRESDVKPKLDKFILTKLGNGNYQEGVKQAKTKGWLIGKGDHPALDYKMKIESNNKNNEVELIVEKNKYGKFETFTNYDPNKKKGDKFPFILSDMGGKDHENEIMNFSMFKDISVYFNCSNGKEGLLNSIYNEIESFFAKNNFGRRSTKGFGSYSVIAKERMGKEDSVKWDAKSYYDNGTPVMTFEISGKDDLAKQKMLFDVIDFYWRCLKSGVNYTKRIPPRNGCGNVMIPKKERYLKSYLWTYLNEKNPSYTWEKRKIKTTFGLEGSFPVRTYRDNPNTAIFARGMMGCPDKFEYKVPLNSFYQDKKGEFKENFENHTIQIKSLKEKRENGNVRYEDGIIERIASPIIFKPIIDRGTVRVYILFDEQLTLTLKALPESEKTFKFVNDDGASLCLQIAPGVIDYKELIRTFHRFVWSNPDYVRSLFGEYDGKNNWNSAKINMSKDSSGKIVALKWGDVDIRWKFIPRNFKWENILSPKKNEMRFVSFSQIVK